MLYLYIFFIRNISFDEKKFAQGPMSQVGGTDR